MNKKKKQMNKIGPVANQKYIKKIHYVNDADVVINNLFKSDGKRTDLKGKCQ